MIRCAPYDSTCLDNFICKIPDEISEDFSSNPGGVLIAELGSDANGIVKMYLNKF